MDTEFPTPHKNVDFSNTEPSLFLMGLLSAFDNRFQAIADKLLSQISWKQFFAIICINLCRESPTIKELAEIMGSSHQNVKQILLKLEKKGFVRIEADRFDKRKQRILLTEECMRFCEENDKASDNFIAALFQNIPQEQLLITTQTILQMENNLKEITYEENSHHL